MATVDADSGKLSGPDLNIWALVTLFIANFFKTVIFKMCGMGFKSYYINVCINVCNLNQKQVIGQCGRKILLVLF